jgi:hypothetical protein
MADVTNPTPVCYRWKHVKDEVWKYGAQPQHLVPPRGKTLLGYYMIEPLYSEAQLTPQPSVEVLILDGAVWIDTGPYAFKLAYDAGDDGPEALEWYAARVRFALGAKPKRPCTCSPDDYPPIPCAEKYALSECKAAGRISEDAYRQLMKHAHRLAMDGHSELAQHLRDAIYGRGPWESGNETT